MGKKTTNTAERSETELRIVGGRFRGSKLAYHGDRVTRPMKHRVREAIFNLVGFEAEGKHALDLFAGTGALGLEALSRGSTRATFIERHIPTARVVRENIARLAVDSQTKLIEASAFVWAKRDLPNFDTQLPWLVFVSPPYDFFVDRADDMLALIQAIATHAPRQSTIVVEADQRFDFSKLPQNNVPDDKLGEWDVRTYPPAVVGVWRKLESPTTSD